MCVCVWGWAFDNYCKNSSVVINCQSSQGHCDVKFLPYNTACNLVELNWRCAAKSFMLLFHCCGN